MLAQSPDNDRANPSGRPAAFGCVVFLVDESTALEARVAGGTKTKAESVATAVNSLLSQLAAGPAVDVALVGYRAAEGKEAIGCRWQGPLAERRFVSSTELADAPLTVETRLRRVPAPGGVGVAREETVSFPVWYVPQLGEAASKVAAFEHCRDLISEWLSTAGPNLKPPMVVSFVGQVSPELGDEALPTTIEGMSTPGGPPLVLHAHLSSSDRVPATLYPSTDAHLPPGEIRTLFHAAGELPEPLRAALRRCQVPVNPGARGLVYHAKMTDVIRLLSLVKTYAQEEPLPAAAATVADEAPARASDRPPPEALCEADAPCVAAEAALIVLLLDRSVENPAGPPEDNVWRRLEASANDLLQSIARKGSRAVDVAVVSYGRGRDAGGCDLADVVHVENTFSGALAAETIVNAAELARGALRTEEVVEKVPNGIGGLVELRRRKPVFVDLEPTGPAASASPGFAAAKGLIDEWRKGRPEHGVLPVVVHMTRGRFQPSRIQGPATALLETKGVVLYHLVLTESPHPSVAYADQPSQIRAPELAALWELTSPLLSRNALAARGRAVSPRSRGMVINGKFDRLLDGIEESLAAAEAAPSPSVESSD
ncbi:MAG: hypothetical protein ACYTG0_23195 [Planctomycetota bacterium]